MLIRFQCIIHFMAICIFFIGSISFAGDLSIIARALAERHGDDPLPYRPYLVRIDLNATKTSVTIHKIENYFGFYAKKDTIIVQDPVGSQLVNFNTRIMKKDQPGNRKIDRILEMESRGEGVSARQFCLSNDLKKLAFIAFYGKMDRDIMFSFSSAIFVLDIPSNQLKQITPYGDNIEYPSISPDGKWVAFFRAPIFTHNIFEVKDLNNQLCQNLCLTTIDGGSITEVSKPFYYRSREDYLVPAWSPDGKRILFAAQYDSPLASREKIIPQGIYLSDIWKKNVERLTPPQNGKECYAPSWSPDGKEFCYLQNKNLMIMNMLTKESRVLISNQNVIKCAWCPEDNLIAYIENPESPFLSIISVDGRQQLNKVCPMDDTAPFFWTH